MIESIKLSNIATYKASQHLNGLSQFNFIFGGNGSGKTTITKVIADENAFPTCSIRWKDNTPLRALVYNEDFIANHFHQSAEIKGIFTLGSENLSIEEQIRGNKTKLEKFQEKILKAENNKSAKQSELSSLEEEFKNFCWSIYSKHKDSPIVSVFEGLRSKKELFKNEVLQQSENNTDTSESLELAILEEKARVIFGKDLAFVGLMSTIDSEITDIVKHESNSILKKCILGKNNIDIAKIIQQLGNSDWVKAGRGFYEKIDQKICPFCQQETQKHFTQNLSDYFDETYQLEMQEVDNLISDYERATTKLQQKLNIIPTSPTEFLDISILEDKKRLLDSRLSINSQKLSLKKKEPSQSVALDSVSIVLSEIKNLIDSANEQIEKHNALIRNRVEEKNILKSQVWKYLVGIELKDRLTRYNKDKDSLLKAIKGLGKNIDNWRNEKSNIDSEIARLQEQITSIQPTMVGMNNILASFGFQGFSFVQADGEIAAYKLVRSDGTDAKRTLSEGEKSFITFLYFYHLIKGSNAETGAAENRVVVFDDPVSSLDSDILFIVSSLIKGIFNEVRNQTGYIKQVFIFTHNIYFHNEVTFNAKRAPNSILKEETFWIVRKLDLVTKLEKQTSNPIKNSYNLLWSEIRNKTYSNLNIQNILRRILEYYFKLLGELDFTQFCELFDGREKIICNTLTSQFHEGSQPAYDDAYVSSQYNSTPDTYLHVFKAIFEKSGHIKHYEMMMRTSNQEA
ncbi:MAG: AAA family ATPase [Thiotrichaceae bacterium]|nr:AAA family ATPase [Thiotrichaceae bacterium]